LYPVVSVKKFDEQPLTAEIAKKLLGWTVKGEDEEWDSYLFKDETGRQVQCTNNLNNRPIRPRQVEAVRQEILRKQWQFNGETIIISRSGKVFNGQHRLVGLVLASEFWEKHKDDYPEWKTAPVINTIVVFGIADDPAVQNSIDNGVSRTLQDVLYLSPYFRDLGVGDRKNMSKMAAHAVKMLWARTGQGASAYSPNRTHTESIEMIDRHDRLLQAVKFIYELNKGENVLGKLVTPGYCSCLMYLMGVSASDPKVYYAKSFPDESDLDFTMWEKAEEFFTRLAAGDVIFSDLRHLYAEICTHNNDEESQGLGGTSDERVALMIHAWLQFSQDKPMTKGAIRLEYTVKEEIKRLASFPSVGGIDKGEDDVSILLADDSSQEDETVISTTSGKVPAIPGTKWKKEGSLRIGGLYWSDKDHQGYLQEVNGRTATLSANKEVWTCDVNSLSIEKPKTKG